MAEEAVFGRYRLLALLGRGGMGEVWHARDTHKGREVALKILGSWLGADPGYARRFRREAALAAGLNAPNIIPIHDYGEIDGQLYMEMPLITGTDLDDLITREGPLDPVRAVDVIDQIAAALDAAHKAGLVHRDVKPSNALVTAHRGGDFVYLIDFGIAHSTDGTRLTTTGRELGTLAYMAPERFQGAGDDQRGDVYALACVLFQALTRKAPFIPPDQAHALAFYLNAHLHLPPPQPSASIPELAKAWDAVIARGMAKDPEQRYPNAGALAAAARSALTGASTRDEDASLIDNAMVDVASKSVADTDKAEPTHVGQSPINAAATMTIANSGPVVTTPVAPSPSVATLTATSSTSRPTEALRQPTSATAAQKSATESQKRRIHPRRRRSIGLVALILTAAGVAATLVSTGSNIVPQPSVPITASLAPPIMERQLSGHTGAVLAVATAQLNGRPVVISGGADKTVRVWDLATGQPIGAPFIGHTGAVYAVATAQLNGRPAIVSSSGAGDNTVRTWDLTTGQSIGAPFKELYEGEVFAVTTAQLNGRPVVISADAWGTVQVSDLTTGQLIGAPLTDHGNVVQAVTTTQLDGRSVVISGGWEGVGVWDLAAGHQFSGTQFFGYAVSAIATAQLNGRPVVISGSSEDKTIRVWDLATGQPIGTPFTGDTGPVRSVAIAQLNGRTVVISGSDDDTVRVWDLAARASS